jgi:hypothetical protein
VIILTKEEVQGATIERGSWTRYSKSWVASFLKISRARPIWTLHKATKTQIAKTQGKLEIVQVADSLTTELGTS